MVVGDLEREAQRGCQRGLELAGLAGAQPAHGEPEAAAQGQLATQRLRLVGVAGGQQGAPAVVARVDRGGLLEFGHEGRVGLRAGQTQAQERLLGEQGLADRREHAGGHARAAGAGLVALEHDHVHAALSGAPGHRHPNDTGAEDGKIESVGAIGQCGSLRRQYPGQVQTVGGPVAPALSARW